MKGSMKYVMDKYGNDQARYHIIIRHPDDKSFQSHEICFNTNHVNVTALKAAVDDLLREDEIVPALHIDLQKANEAFESNTLTRNAEKVRLSSSSSLSSSSTSSQFSSSSSSLSLSFLSTS